MVDGNKAYKRRNIKEEGELGWCEGNLQFYTEWLKESLSGHLNKNPKLMWEWAMQIIVEEYYSQIKELVENLWNKNLPDKNSKETSMTRAEGVRRE